MYKCVLIKLSGESLMNDKENINKDKTREIAKLIKRVHELGVNVGIVVGGGNFFRGRSNQDMEPINADGMGMLGTTMNAFALRDAFTKEGIPNIVYSPFSLRELVKSYTDEEVKEICNGGTVVVFSGGTGHIGCSTDTAASEKAAVINADAIIKLTNVEGVYDKDPNKYSDAVMYDKLTHQEVLDNKEIKVMDLDCIKDCLRDNRDIRVINFNNQENLFKVLEGQEIGTLITSK